MVLFKYIHDSKIEYDLLKTFKNQLYLFDNKFVDNSQNGPYKIHISLNNVPNPLCIFFHKISIKITRPLFKT